MPWSDFAKTRQISDVKGDCHEVRGHFLEISGTEDDPAVVCRTPGCSVYYHDKHFAGDQLIGKLSAGGVECRFTITYNGKKKKIHCQLDDLDGPGTTGSWTADDPGPGQGNGDGDPTPHHQP